MLKFNSVCIYWSLLHKAHSVGGESPERQLISLRPFITILSQVTLMLSGTAIYNMQIGIYACSCQSFPAVVISA